MILDDLVKILEYLQLEGKGKYEVQILSRHFEPWDWNTDLEVEHIRVDDASKKICLNIKEDL